MKITNINNNMLPKQTFGAKPVGYAKELINDILVDTFERYDSASKDAAKTLLYKISKIGKHYNGENKQLEIYAEKLDNGAIKFTTNDTDEELCLLSPIEDNLRFLRSIYDVLLQKKQNIRKQDAIREASDFLGALYGE